MTRGRVKRTNSEDRKPKMLDTDDECTPEYQVLHPETGPNDCSSNRPKSPEKTPKRGCL